MVQLVLREFVCLRSCSLYPDLVSYCCFPVLISRSRKHSPERKAQIGRIQRIGLYSTFPILENACPGGLCFSYDHINGMS
jgi:hypothetical protein